MSAKRDLLDADGENRAVRAFLSLYGCSNSVNVESMKAHLEQCGFNNCWPDWVITEEGHLTKGGAQDWLRHLFALEQPAPAVGTLINEGAKSAPAVEDERKLPDGLTPMLLANAAFCMEPGANVPNGKKQAIIGKLIAIADAMQARSALPAAKADLGNTDGRFEGEWPAFEAWAGTLPAPVQANIAASSLRGESYTEKAFYAGYRSALPDQTKIEWVDQWQGKGSMTIAKASATLKELFDAWPGGLEEIESCISGWQARSALPVRTDTDAKADLGNTDGRSDGERDWTDAQVSAFGEPLDDSDRLKPCAFCGSDAEILAMPAEAEDNGAGAMFVQCTNSMCLASSCLIYPLGDDPKPLLMEKWNRRPVTTLTEHQWTDEQIRDAWTDHVAFDPEVHSDWTEVLAFAHALLGKQS